MADGEPLDLRNRELAAFLAWLIPGAGHYYQRRYFKSAIFSISILSTFLIGMLVGGGHCVYASWNKVDARLAVCAASGRGIARLACGLPAYRVNKNLPPALGGFMAPPASINDLSEWNEKSSSGFDMGTLYTMIAGLLNILVVFDAWGGPLPPPAKPQRGKHRARPMSHHLTKPRNRLIKVVDTVSGQSRLGLDRVR